jgi:hypothetical protein
VPRNPPREKHRTATPDTSERKISTTTESTQDKSRQDVETRVENAPEIVDESDKQIRDDGENDMKDAPHSEKKPEDKPDPADPATVPTEVIGEDEMVNILASIDAPSPFETDVDETDDDKNEPPPSEEIATETKDEDDDQTSR